MFRLSIFNLQAAERGPGLSLASPALWFKERNEPASYPTPAPSYGP